MTSLVQRKFGDAAADYAASAVHAKGESLARLIELVDPQPNWRVLDVATGAGHTALTFAPHVAKVTATDITHAMLAETRKLAHARGLHNVRVGNARAEDLPYPDMSFDLVTCRLAAHHFRNVPAFAAEAFRVLMPGGRLGLVDNISPEKDGVSAAYNAFEKLRDPGHRHCLSLDAWKQVLDRAGFTVERKKTLDQDIEFGPWAARRRCDAPTEARLRDLLANEPLRSLLRPRDRGAGLVFTLREAIIAARKPV